MHKPLRLLTMCLLCAWQTPVLADSCLIAEAAGATLVEFAPYTSGGPAVLGDGQINLQCTPDAMVGVVSYTVAIGTGEGSNSFAPRVFAGATADLEYNLYLDPARLVVFGDGSAGTQTLPGVCNGACVVQVYGRIDGGQLVPGGTYTDDVEVTIEF